MLFPQFGYYVFGGRLEPYLIKRTFSKKKAIRFARKHREYWGTKFGWYVPEIYRGCDVEVVTARDMIFTPNGCKMYAPKVNALPCMIA